METDLKPASSIKPRPGRLYDEYFINEYGRIEGLRASRYNTYFSVVLARAEATGEASARKDGARKEALEKITALVLDSVRNCDVVGSTSDGDVIAILPETDYFGSLSAVRKLTRSAAEILGKSRGVSSYIAQATFPKDGRGFGELLASASNRIREKKESIWETGGYGGKLFWEAIGALLSSGHKDKRSAAFDLGQGHPLPGTFMDRVNEMILREIARSPQRRGILYMWPGKDTSRAPYLSKALEMRSATRTFVVSETVEGPGKGGNSVTVDDPRLREASFTFYLGEGTGYAIVWKENWGDTFSCFHTCDPCVVEGLIIQFQNEYSLQEQLG